MLDVDEKILGPVSITVIIVTTHFSTKSLLSLDDIIRDLQEFAMSSENQSKFLRNSASWSLYSLLHFLPAAESPSSDFSSALHCDLSGQS